jgi:hypothetical protein
MKILLSASLARSVPPAGTVSALAGSSLMVMVTFPVDTRRERAAMSTPTSARITAVNMPMPRRISAMAV